MQPKSDNDPYLSMILRRRSGCIWATDLELRFTHVDANLPEEIGPGPEVGTTVYDFVGSRRATEPGIAHHLAALAGDPQSFTCEYRGRWYELMIDPLRSAGGGITGTVGAAFDVTERRAAEELLARDQARLAEVQRAAHLEAMATRERSLSLLEATLEATADGILVVDRTGQVTLMNQRLRALFDLPAQNGALPDEQWVVTQMLTRAADAHGFRAGILEVQDRPELERNDAVRLKDGRVFERYSRPQRLGDAVVGRVWSYRDVSEHARLLREAELLAHASRLLTSLDIDGALREMARFLIPELAEACAIDLILGGAPHRRVAISRAGAQPTLPDADPRALAGHGVLCQWGSASCLGVPLLVQGAVAGVITLVAPLGRNYGQPELYLAEELARRAALALDNARLYQRACDALRARDEFLAIAAHEIRGPITSMQLSLQSLRRGQLPEETRAKAFDILERQTQRLTTFVNELLDLGRLRQGKLGFALEEVELGAVVSAAATALAHDLASSGSHLSLQIARGVRGTWDPLRLDQVVTNLLTNAIKFGAGKPITVEVFTREERAVLMVRDQGIGIAPEMQPRVFERFERGVSTRHYGGLGLGLYIVKNIVEGLGGCVGVRSAPNEGSTFTVELPLPRQS